MGRYKSFVENSGIGLPVNWSTTWETQFANNYISVDIVSETTRVETYTDDASIGAIDLLSNVVPGRIIKNLKDLIPSTVGRII
jgi:hypothetical protein